MPLTEKGKHLQLGFQELGEWNGSATSGTFTLSNDVNATKTIDIDGRCRLLALLV